MKIKYFEDTDTALLELSGNEVAETRELSEDIYLDYDQNGNVVSITLEHASRRGDVSDFSFQRVAGRSSEPLETISR